MFSLFKGACLQVSQISTGNCFQPNYTAIIGLALVQTKLLAIIIIISWNFASLGVVSTSHYVILTTNTYYYLLITN